MVSLTHIGATSFEFSRGISSTLPSLILAIQMAEVSPPR